MTRLPDFSIAQLRHFVLIAEAGSFKEAALLAHRSQSALSLSLKEMEQRLGQPLFEPTARVVLTPYGRQCLPIVRRLLDQYRQSAESMAELALCRQGRLRLAYVVTAISVWLYHVMPRYVASRPGVRISLIDDHSPNIERMILADEVDFGLCSPASADKRLSFRPLVDDHFGLVCCDDHPLASRQSIACAELAGLDLIGSPGHLQLPNTAESAELLGLFDSAALHASHMMTMVTMLELGLGVTVLGQLGIPPFAKGLVFVPLIEPKIKRQLGILRLAGHTLSPAAAEMESLLIEHVSGLASHSF